VLAPLTGCPSLTGSACGSRLSSRFGSRPSLAKVDDTHTMMTIMSYMDDLLADLRGHWGLDEEAVEFVKDELIRSFKNGLMRGREQARAERSGGGKRGNPRKDSRRRDLTA
jgi:hypothetical protein